MKIAIIGAGWYGAHIAITLAKLGHEVNLFEKNPDIFSELSAKFGVRLHRGPHYPRSKKTRESCQSGFEEFKKAYRELIVQHANSIYALGIKDADGNPPKISVEEFDAVCHETKTCRPLELEQWRYQNLHSAYDLDEPSIVVGKVLRAKFREYLNAAGVKLSCNYSVDSINRVNESFYLNDETAMFDKVINATSYQALLHHALR